MNHEISEVPWIFWSLSLDGKLSTDIHRGSDPDLYKTGPILLVWFFYTYHNVRLYSKTICYCAVTLRNIFKLSKCTEKYWYTICNEVRTGHWETDLLTHELQFAEKQSLTDWRNALTSDQKFNSLLRSSSSSNWEILWNALKNEELSTLS